MFKGRLSPSECQQFAGLVEGCVAGLGLSLLGFLFLVLFFWFSFSFDCASRRGGLLMPVLLAKMGEERLRLLGPMWGLGYGARFWGSILVPFWGRFC